MMELKMTYREALEIAIELLRTSAYDCAARHDSMDSELYDESSLYYEAQRLMAAANILKDALSAPVRAIGKQRNG